MRHIARLVIQLETALVSRSEIDQAKGALRARTGCTADQAFATLVDQSERRNIKLRDLFDKDDER
jgi:AmiR/NasT family two-component response regulator